MVTPQTEAASLAVEEEKEEEEEEEEKMMKDEKKKEKENEDESEGEKGDDYDKKVEEEDAKDNKRLHLLLAATGSVATIKLPNIISALAPHAAYLSIRVILTARAQHFLAGQSAEQPTASSLLSLPGVEAVYDDSAEWGGAQPWRRGDDVLHISLRRWADLLVVAPLSANTLAKLAHGFSDNLLTSVCRAWDFDGQVDGRRKRIVVACAMNTAMWRHPVTAKNLGVLEEEWGVRTDEHTGEETGWFEVLPPQATKTLACGDVGSGAMMEWTEIVRIIEDRLGLRG